MQNENVHILITQHTKYKANSFGKYDDKNVQLTLKCVEYLSVNSTIELRQNWLIFAQE